MGVSISLNGKDITPGWRSMMYGLLEENFQHVYPSPGVTRFIIFKSDVPRLRQVKRKQKKGEKEPPFEYASDIEKSFDKIIRVIQKHGEAQVDCEW